MVESLPSDGDDEMGRTIAAEEAKARVLDSMRDVGSFGEEYRNNRRLQTIEKPKNETNYNQTLSDISDTF